MIFPEDKLALIKAMTNAAWGGASVDPNCGCAYWEAVVMMIDTVLECGEDGKCDESMRRPAEI